MDQGTDGVSDLPSRKKRWGKSSNRWIEGGWEVEKADADVEAEEKKVEVDDDGEAAEEGWKGTDLTSQMQEGAGGLFWVSGERKTWEKYGETGRGEKRRWGVNGPQNSPGISVARCSLCRTARTRALLTCLIVPSTYIVWSCTNGANRIEQAQQ